MNSEIFHFTDKQRENPFSPLSVDVAHKRCSYSVLRSHALTSSSSHFLLLLGILSSHDDDATVTWKIHTVFYFSFFLEQCRGLYACDGDDEVPKRWKTFYAQCSAALLEKNSIIYTEFSLNERERGGAQEEVFCCEIFSLLILRLSVENCWIVRITSWTTEEQVFQRWS